MQGNAPFDRALLRRRLGRALMGAYPGFLVERATDDLADRLAAVTRRYAVGIDLGTPVAAVTAPMRSLCDQVVRIAGHHADVVADEEALPLADGSIGLVVSLLALQGVNDLPGCLAQVRRALAPDGLFLACLLGGDSLTELRQAFAAAEAELEGGVSPRIAPFVDIRGMGGLLQRAGFALPVVDLDRVVVRYATPFGLLRDLRALGWTNPLAERRRTPLRRATLLRACAIYAERFADPDGRVRATFDLVWLSGWAPHESQQKPLRPGSARARLADALGVPELGPTGDPR